MRRILIAAAALSAGLLFGWGAQARVAGDDLAKRLVEPSTALSPIVPAQSDGTHVQPGSQKKPQRFDVSKGKSKTRRHVSPHHHARHSSAVHTSH